MTFMVDRSRKLHWFNLAVNGWFPGISIYTGSEYSVAASEPLMSANTLKTFQDS